MINGTILFQLQITMFIMLGTGYICAKLGLFTAKGRESVVNVLINVMIPCSIIMAFYNSLTIDTLLQGIWMVLAYTFNLCFAWAIGKILYRKIEADKQSVLKYATIISNAQFMGFPVVQAAVGETGLILASLAMIPATIFTWTIAVAQFAKTDGKKGIRSVLDNTCFLSAIIGILLVLLKVPLHPCITDALERFGNCVMPVSMLVIGSILAGVKLNSILDWRLYYFSLIRLIGIPAVLYFIFTLVNLDEMVKTVVVLMAAMPAGTVTAMLAEKHGANAEFASELIFVSTLLSIFTLSVLAALL